MTCGRSERRPATLAMAERRNRGFFTPATAGASNARRPRSRPLPDRTPVFSEHSRRSHDRSFFARNLYRGRQDRRLRADRSAGVPARRSIHCEPSRGRARRTATGSGFGRARRNGPTSRHRARHLRVPRSGHARSALVDWRAAFRRTRHAQPAGARCRCDRRQRATDGTGGHGSRERAATRPSLALARTPRHARRRRRTGVSGTRGRRRDRVARPRWVGPDGSTAGSGIGRQPL